MKTMTKTLGWLVMAAALTFGFSACSSDDDAVAEKPTVNPAVTADGKVHVTVGAGISDGQTRTAVEKDGTSRTLKFTTGDKLYILGDIESNMRLMGGLIEVESISEDGKSATFDGDLTVWKNPGDGNWQVDTDWAATQTGETTDPMDWYGENAVDGWLVHADAVSGLYYTTWDKLYSFQYEKSLVTGATDNDNVSELMKSALYVHCVYNEADKCFELECCDPILNCTFSGLAANTEYYVRFAKSNNEDDYKSGNYIYFGDVYNQTITTDGEGTARFAISVNRGDFYEFCCGIQLCADDQFGSREEGSDVFVCILGRRDEIGSKVYNISRHWNGTEFVRVVDLSKYYADNYRAQDGDVLTGELQEGCGVLIPGGVTVTLFNATINSWGDGIECFFGDDGDNATNATIILEGSNTVTGSSDAPGIFVPEDFTLTIKGSGSLTAEGGTVDDGEHKLGGAGIGGCPDGGNVIIEGGTITVKGGYGAPGIGGSYDSQKSSSFGTITIKNTVTSVTATKGTDAPYCIGPSLYGSCGTITFGDGVVYNGSVWDAGFGGLTVSPNEAGDTWTLTPAP